MYYKENWLDKLFPKGIAWYRASYVFTHPWKIFIYLYYETKYVCQRIFRGWDDRVIFSVDYYLAKMLPIWLRAIKDESTIPASIYNVTDDHLIDFEEAIKMWHNILDEMILGFERAKKIIELDYDIKSEDFEKSFNEDKILLDQSLNLFREYFLDLWT